MSRTNRRLLIPASLLLAAACAAAYLPALSAGFVWSDAASITHNELLRGIEGLRRIWSDAGGVPVALTGFWLQYQAWGPAPLGYHLVNVLLHAANAVLVYLGLCRLRTPGALLAAAVFALHPLQVQSVAWVSQFPNTLAAFFALASLYCALAYYRLGEESLLEMVGDLDASTARRPRLLACSLALFALALAAGPSVSPLPVALLLLVWYKRGRLALRDLAPSLPFFALAAAAVWWAPGNVPDAAWRLSPAEETLVAGRALWFYLGKVFWPSGLAFGYPRWHVDARAWWQYLHAAAFPALVALLWHWRGRLGRGPLAGLLFFACLIAPAIGLIPAVLPRVALVADHVPYLACLGPMAVACAALARPFTGSPVRSRVLALLAVAPLALMAWQTWGAASEYRDAETLYRATLARHPDSFLAHNNLGALLHDRGDAEAAAHEFQEALRLDPHAADALANLGFIRTKQGRTDEATALYEQAVRERPSFTTALNHLGLLYADQGRYDEALETYERAIRQRPDYAAPYNNAAAIRYAQGRYDEALKLYFQALAIHPLYRTAYTNIGTIFLKEGRFEEAAAFFQAAIGKTAEDPKLQQQVTQAVAFFKKKQAEAAASPAP